MHTGYIKSVGANWKIKSENKNNQQKLTSSKNSKT